jgi:hypothetical protein
MATVLGEVRLAAGLQALPGWRRVGHRVVRDVSVTPAEAAGLCREVMALASDKYGPRTWVNTDTGGLHIRVGSPGHVGITAADLEHAQRIEQRLADVSRTGRR